MYMYNSPLVVQQNSSQCYQLYFNKTYKKRLHTSKQRVVCTTVKQYSV